MALQALYLWQRYNDSRAVSFFLCDSHRRCLDMYVFVRFCMEQVCVSGVCVVIGTQNDQKQRFYL